MKGLTRLVALTPLIFCLGCDTIYNFFNPKNPNPITPNTNNPPSANLVITPISGYAPLETNISLTGTDPDGDSITEYQVKIDLNDNGIVDEGEEIITSPTPIQTIRTFENIGKVRIYGQCRDEKGLKSNRKNVEIIVSESIPENQLPYADFLISPTSGEYPLTTNIQLVNGRDEDGEITGYKIEIDIGEDGIIERRIPENGSFSNAPLNITETIDNIGNVRIYGIVLDNQDGETIESVSINVLERNDLVGNITFSQGFHKGDYLNFIGTIQNNTPYNILADNSNGNSLEYRLIRNDGTVVLNKKFEENAQIRFLSPNGYITLDYLTNQLKIGNVDIPKSSLGVFLWDTLCEFGLVGSDGEYSLSIPPLGYPFKESGTYFVEIFTKYLMNGNEYHKKFTSSNFVVED